MDRMTLRAAFSVALLRVSAGVRRPAGDDAEEDAAEQVDVAAHVDAVARVQRLLGGHVGRRAAAAGALGDVLGLALRGHAGGQAPVHHQHLPVVAEHHVLGLQVPVDDAARVGEGHGVADAQQDLQVLAQPEPVHRLLPGAADDALHGVEGAPLGILLQRVDGDDVGMVEVAGDDGLRGERPCGRLGPPVAAQRLEGHLPVEVPVERPVDHAHAPPADDLQHIVADGIDAGLGGQLRARRVLAGQRGQRLSRGGGSFGGARALRERVEGGVDLGRLRRRQRPLVGQIRQRVPGAAQSRQTGGPYLALVRGEEPLLPRGLQDSVYRAITRSHTGPR